MTPEDKHFIASIAEFAVSLSVKQVMLMRFTIGHVNGIYGIQALRRKLDAAPDSDAKAELNAAEDKMLESLTQGMQPMRDALARLESEDEKFQHLVAVWKSQLPPLD